MNKISFIAYAEYFNDARIKSYINSLTNENYKVDLFCLYDIYSSKYSSKNERLRIFFISKKYQGNSQLLYLFNYLIFFLKSFFLVSIKYLKERYLVFHINNQPDFLVFIPLIPKLFGSRIILDLHDIMIAGVMSKFNSNENNLLYKFTKLQTKLSVKFCDVLICADHSQKEFLNEQGIYSKNSFVFLNLPDDKIFRRSKFTYLSDGCTRLIFHGTLTERLGLDIVIKAVEIASKEIDISFTIIGNGDFKDNLIKLCKENRLLNRIIFFKDFIPVENLQKEIEKYDIGVIGNRKSLISERCMLPVKLLEYLYIGLPVIAPRLNVINRYFSDDMIEYYEPENIKELSIKIVELARDPNKCERLVDKSKEFFEKYNNITQKSEYLRLIETLYLNNI